MRTYNTIKVFNEATCKYDTYKRNACGGWTKVVKRRKNRKQVCRPITVKQVCKPVVCECIEYIYC